MKFETTIMLVKGWCIVSGAVAGAFIAGLDKLPGPTLLGVDKLLLGFLAGLYVVAVNGTLAFLSQSFGGYLTGRGNGNTVTIKPE